MAPAENSTPALHTFQVVTGHIVETVEINNLLIPADASSYLSQPGNIWGNKVLTFHCFLGIHSKKADQDTYPLQVCIGCYSLLWRMPP